jgi:hypothetical protein
MNLRHFKIKPPEAFEMSAAFIIFSELEIPGKVNLTK